MSYNARTAFTLKTPSNAAFRVYAFSGTEEMHRPYEFEIELVHEASNVDFSYLLGQTACLSVSECYFLMNIDLKEKLRKRLCSHSPTASGSESDALPLSLIRNPTRWCPQRSSGTFPKNHD
jgi:hypothetical protein